jgi:hypothetical protein
MSMGTYFNNLSILIGWNINGIKFGFTPNQVPKFRKVYGIEGFITQNTFLKITPKVLSN